MSKKKQQPKRTQRIIQGGMNPTPYGLPDIVMQMPNIFMFDMSGYISAVKSAMSIDYSRRTLLYDLYESAILDLHLQGILAKRLRGVTQIPIEFRRDGKVDEEITELAQTATFRNIRKDILLSEFYGFSLIQVYRDEAGKIKHTSINRKHVNTLRREVLKQQGDNTGTPFEAFENLFFVGSERSLGIYAELMPAVLYKRGNISDWARFCNIFGIPIRDYTYDAGDEEARRRVIQDAKMQGANAVYIHPKESELTLIEAGNKSGSSELFRTFAEYWDKAMSIRVLGNTLTTAAQETGTQALGTVHKEEEDEMNADDRQFILDVFNDEMLPIFENLGYRVEGGRFVYAKKEKVNLAQQLTIVKELSAMGLPMDDDYLYDTFGVAKPTDYNAVKVEKKAQRKALAQALNTPKEKKEKEDKNSFKDHLSRFFAVAPK